MTDAPVPPSSPPKRGPRFNFWPFKTKEPKLAVGEVNPKDQNIQQLAEQSGGVVFTGEINSDIGIGVFPVNKPKSTTVTRDSSGEVKG